MKNWRPYVAEAKYETLRTLRTPGFAVPFLLLPIALYLFFGVYLAGSMSKGDPEVAVYMFVNWAVFGIMGPAMFGFGVFVATDRDQGLLALKRALPMPPAAYLIAKMFMAMLFTAIIMASLILAAILVGHPKLTGGQLATVAAVDMLGALPFCAIGLFIGTRTSAKSAPAFANLAYLPMIYLSGLFFPMPKSIHAIQFASPAYYLDQLALRAAGVHVSGSVMIQLAVLAGVTLLLSFFSVRRLGVAGNK